MNEPPPHHLPGALRWAPHLYFTIAFLLIPWIVWLSVTLPGRARAAHYRLAWVGFDCLLAAAFARTGYLALRQRWQTELAAIVTATLLIVDAWFDITTASGRTAVVQAVVLAVFGEIPAAVASIYIVRHVNRVVVARLGGARLNALGAEARSAEDD